MKRSAQRDHPLARANRYERPVFARVRRMCLAFPDSTETVAWGHPAFKVRGKMFCAFEVIGGRPSVAFRVRHRQLSAALKDTRCFASPYGRGLWVSVWVDGTVDWQQITAFVERSHRSVVPRLSRTSRGRQTGRPLHTALD